MSTDDGSVPAPPPRPFSLAQSQTAAPPMGALADFISEATGDGLFPAIAFGLDPNEAPSIAALLTSPIHDFPIALKLVERITHEGVVPNRFVPLKTLQYIADKNAIMRCHLREIPGFDSRLTEHKKALSGLFAFCTASRWASRAFALVDMVGFSLKSTPEQLALRMSLGQAINTSIRRLQNLVAKGLVTERPFTRISTGDGFYFWNFDPSPEGHVATFLLLLFLMSHTEALFASGVSALRLRAAFGIGEAYTFPYNGPSPPPRERYRESFMPDAIGPVLNEVARFLTVAAPGQILVAPFDEPGRENRRSERLNVRTMLTRVKLELLPAELLSTDPVKAQDSELETRPAGLLRVTDKHGVVHHCYNIAGTLPYRDRDGRVGLRAVGLLPDEAQEVSMTRFREP